MSVMHNNIYVHSNPPKAVSGSGFAIRQWVRNGDLDKLEATVLEGQGARLLGLAESASDSRVKAFLRSVPGLMAKVDMIHDAVSRGSLRETQALLDKKKLATARDAVGRGLPHKAILYNNKAVIEWLAKKHPETLNLRDNEGRTPLHYSAAAKDPEDMYSLLINLGANADFSDIHGNKPLYYVQHPEELDIEGPNTTGTGPGAAGSSTGRLSRGKRRRISPISKESHSPRKFIMSPVSTITNSVHNLGNNISSYLSPHQISNAPSVSRAQIRIWIHEKDIPKLERIVWTGNGDKLLLETSNNGKVRRFLDNVPHLLARIKSVHAAAINNDVDTLKDIRRRSSELIEIFQSQDSHGLTAIHKASGLGNRPVLEFLIYEVPDLINATDHEGKTPLHYSAKDSSLYTFLVKAGADENTADLRGRTPLYYRTHQNELDTRYLRNVPDAPRVQGDIPGWDRGSIASSGGAGAGFGGTVRSNTNSNFNSNKRRPSDDFSPSNEIVEATGKFDLENVDVQLREDELRISDDFEMSEEGGSVDTGEEKKEEVKVNGIGGSEEEEPDLSEADPAAPQEVVPKENGPRDPTPWPMNETVELVNESVAAVVQAQQEPPAASVEMEMQMNETVEMVNERIASSRAKIGIERPPFPNETVEMVNEDNGPQAKSAAKRAISKLGSNEIEVNDADIEAALRSEVLDGGGRSGGGDEEATLEEQIAEDAGELPADRISDEQPPSEIDDTEPEEPAPGPNTTNIANGGNEDDEIDTALRKRDMETLVDKILQGQGTMLLNRRTSHPDVQEFLNNVPAYMTKISAIHTAASIGSLRDLQALLDRKRLALARDEYGRGPLHLAVMNNHVHIAKHLANSFPQCLGLLDRNGRSPLHYAAALPDSGTMYKYLVNWGADPNSRDEFNNTPGIYLRNRDLMSLQDLMEGRAGDGVVPGGSSGAAASVTGRAASRDSLVRKKSRSGGGTGASGNPGNTKSGVGTTRSSVVVAGVGAPAGGGVERWERPKTPDVAAIAALDTFYETILMREESFWTRAWRRLTTTTQGNIQVKLMVKKYLTRSLFNEIKRLSTVSGATLMDVLKFYPQFFIVASDPEVYDVFRQLFIPALADVNKTSLGTASAVVGGNYVFGDSPSTALPVCEIATVDVPSKYVSLVRMRLSRNILPHPFLPFMKREDMTKVGTVLKTISLNWPCFDLEFLDKETRETLEKICWLPEVSKLSRYWPKSRFFLLSHDHSVQVWINAEDHLDIIVQSKYGKLYPMLETMNEIYYLYCNAFDFYKNDDYGFLTVDPFRCGTGLKITFRIRLPTLMQDRLDLTALVTELNLNIRWKQNRVATSATKNIEISPDDWVEVENVTTLGINELELCQRMSEAMNKLIKAEEERTRIVAMIEAANKTKK